MQATIVWGAIGICFFVIFELDFFSYKKNEQYIELPPNSVEAITQQENHIEEIAIPIKLSISSINIEAPIELVGVSDGKMSVPTLPENVGWYKFGARPGDVGSAVLAGHVNWKNNPDAVFTNLKNIIIGDTIEAINSDGETISFLVHTIKKYSLDADTTEVFLSDDGLSHLNLITCSGLWNPILGSHELRLVVFATKL
jgi:LPXTG-site transpeptidase (sortase) family protein